MKKQDVIIIGAGIIGLATAYQLSRIKPKQKLLILEKDANIAQHQSGNNSGVIHSGIYYKPNSLKAKNCLAGKARLEAFAEQYSIPYEICGKLIVAVSEDELPALAELHRKGIANGVKCELIKSKQIKQYEPAVQGIEALYIPEAGIIDYRAVCRKLAELVIAEGHEILTNVKVSSLEIDGSACVLNTSAGQFTSSFCINCAGLYSDKLAATASENLNHKIIPFRGEYYCLKDSAKALVKNLIYPVPDPRFPFLGVHFTRTISGKIECGPNAVFALAREAYSWKKFSFKETLEAVAFPGFQKMAWRYAKEGISEMYRSLSKAAFLKALQRLIPDLKLEDIEPMGAGIRAQAVTKDGKLVDDFLFAGKNPILHVLNTPSPAATASLEIGRVVVDKLSLYK